MGSVLSPELVLNTYTCIKIGMVFAVLIIEFTRYYLVQH